jgi:hypothetical protein
MGRARREAKNARGESVYEAVFLLEASEREEFRERRERGDTETQRHRGTEK